jgi:UDP-glucose 4-epimerase
VRAYSAALFYLRAGGKSCALSCGYGRGFSILEVIEVVKKISEVDFEVRKAKRRPDNPAELVAKVDRLPRSLDWEPKHDDLETIVSSA